MAHNVFKVRIILFKRNITFARAWCNMLDIKFYVSTVNCKRGSFLGMATYGNGKNNDVLERLR